jgi:site-specific DNA-methyltransferase (adenine-specific)
MIPYFTTDEGVLYYGDALEIPTRIAKNSVHCVVTSPPYWGKVNYLPEEPDQLGFEETPQMFVNKLVEIFKKVREVLHDKGVIWLNIGDTNCVPSTKRETIYGMKPGVPAKNRILIPYRLAIALQEDGWWVRSDNIWYRRNAPRRAVQDRPTYEHEYLFLLTKKSHYYYDHVAVFQPIKAKAGDRYAGDRTKIPTESGKMFKDPKNNVKAKLAGKNLGSVWDIPTQGRTDSHYAAFPDKLVDRCILAGSSKKGCCSECKAPYKRIYKRVSADAIPETVGWEADCDCMAPIEPCVILDPFMGRGTTAMRAEKLKRHWCGVEKDADSCELIKKNLCTRKYGLEPHTQPQDGFFSPDEINTEVR